MTERQGLSPPDPSKDARYWLTSPDKAQVIGMWRARSHRWIAEDWIRPGTPRDFGSVGYRLASPHPIPGPEQLNALHATLGEIDDEQAIFAKTAYQDADYGWLNGTIDALRKIRAALGAKP